MAMTTGISYPYGGSNSDWFYDGINNRMVNKLTGEIVSLNTATSNITTPTKPTISPDPFMEHIVKEIAKMSEQVGEYDALRIYLAANYKEVLEQFDAAYAARKRIAVENK